VTLVVSVHAIGERRTILEGWRAHCGPACRSMPANSWRDRRIISQDWLAFYSDGDAIGASRCSQQWKTRRNAEAERSMVADE
jgi:hypothetical protein